MNSHPGKQFIHGASHWQHSHFIVKWCSLSAFTVLTVLGVAYYMVLISSAPGIPVKARSLDSLLGRTPAAATNAPVNSSAQASNTRR